MFSRIFRTRWFARAQKKAGLTDRDLVAAVRELEQARGVDLGGGVFKKRIGSNRYRAVVLARAGEFWIYVYLFAKQDRSDIEPDELDAFRALADLYRGRGQAALESDIEAGNLQEVKDD